MGECKSVTIGELSKGNKRMCLSALRVFGKCDECRVMQDYYKDVQRAEPRGLKPCESAVISMERIENLKKKAELQGKLKEISEQIKQLNL